MSTEEDRLKCVVGKVARKLGLQNYKLEYRKLDETIENYFGELLSVTLTGETGDGVFCKELIVKFAPSTDRFDDISVLQILYSIEIAVYTVLIPHFKRLSQLDLSELLPECYYSDCCQDNEVLVMKDMCSKGYFRYQRNRFLDPNHVAVSLKSLARFHALSMIVQNDINNLDEWQSMIPYCFDYPPQFLNTLRLCLKNNLDKFSDTKCSDILSTLDNNFDNIAKRNVVNASRLIYGHGDFWKENILFKYENNKPINACILDFQTTRLLSPAQDILGFLLTSVNGNDRRQFYEYFLSTYYDCLQTTLADHRLNANDIYSRSDLDHDLKTVAPFCLISANMSFTVWLGVEDKAFIKSKKNCSQEDGKKSNISNYKEIMLDIIEDFIQFGYL